MSGTGQGGKYTDNSPDIKQEEFVHCHLHTIYSVNDAIIKPPQLFQAIKESAQAGVIVTDHGNIRALPELITESKKAGVPFKIGCEFYFTPGDRLLKDNPDTYHLILIPKDQRGYHDFVRLMSDAGLNKMNVHKSSKYYERTDFAMLEKYGKNIIGSSACIGGVIPKFIQDGYMKAAQETTYRFKECLADFYLELQISEDPTQLVVNQKLIQLGWATNTKCIITSDAHYIKKKDKMYHDILLLAAGRSPYTIETNYIMSERNVRSYCRKYKLPSDTLIQNTRSLYGSIGEISYVQEDKNFFFPSFRVPDGYTEDTFLTKETKKGLLRKFEEQGIKKARDQKRYLKQADYELNQNIIPKGFSGYFLILADLVREAKNRGVLTGPGRGSAAGSIVSYANGITAIDPIKNKLVFERFINRSREEFPDIDIDVAKLRRPEMIEYLALEYNSVAEEVKKTRYELPTGIRVVQLENFTYIGVKNGLKAIMRAYDSLHGTDTFQETNELTRSLASQVEQQPLTPELFEEILFNDKDNWVDTLGETKWQNIEKQYQRLQDFYAKYPYAKDGMDGIRGCITGIGLHAGAVIISGEDLESYVPLARAVGSSVLPVVTYNMAGATLFNLLKIDLLGLRTLSALEEFMNITGLDMEWYESEDFSDKKVYETINKGHVTDGFQLCTNSAKRLLKKFKINCFDDIGAFIAGNRPGPLSVDKVTNKSMMDLYLIAKEGGEVNRIHPDVDKILAETYGTLWYQEQLMNISRVLAGYTMGTADSRIRKVLGKKLLDKIPEIKNEFIYGKQSVYSKIDINNPQDVPKVIGISKENSPYCEGAINRGYNKKMVAHLFANMSEFAKYSFNKAHSSAYADIGYKTMWAKTYFPVEWALSCLTTHDNDDLVKETLMECKRLDIEILGPDINKSETYFSIDIDTDSNKRLRFGLSNIKGVGANAVAIIKYVRDTKGLFLSIEDFYKKIKSVTKAELKDQLNLKSNAVNKTVFEALVLSGAFDSYDKNRYVLFNRLMIGLYQKNSKSKAAIMPYTGIKVYETDPKIKINLEKKYMGMCISDTTLDNYPYTSFGEAEDGEYIETSGIILAGAISKAKNNNDFAKITIEDKFGDNFNVMLFGKNFTAFRDKAFDGDIARVGKVIIVHGEVNKEFNNIKCSKILPKKKSPYQDAKEFIPPLVDLG